MQKRYEEICTLNFLLPFLETNPPQQDLLQKSFNFPIGFSRSMWYNLVVAHNHDSPYKVMCYLEGVQQGYDYKTSTQRKVSHLR